MSSVECPGCHSTNVIRINPLESIPQWKCLSCKRFFILQKDRIKLLIIINQQMQELKDIDRHGVINRRIFEFWSKSDPVFAKYYKMMLEESENLCERLTPATTLERDARRIFLNNSEGLNASYRKERDRSITYTPSPPSASSI